MKLKLEKERINKGEIEMEKKDIKQKIWDLSHELKHMQNVELENAIDIGDSEYFEEINSYISDLKYEIMLLKEDLTKIEKGEIEMENIKIVNIDKVKEFIKKFDNVDFGGFESKFNLDKLLLIAWNETIEIKLNIDFTTLEFVDFYTLIYKWLRTELKKYSNRKKFWYFD